MATTQADLIARLNAVYAMLDDLWLDGDGDQAHLDELAKHRDAVRAAIDALIQRGAVAASAQLDGAAVQLGLLNQKLCDQAATVNKVKEAIDIAAQVIAVAAQVTAKLI